MLVNALIMGLITYTASIVYNLLARRSLETVFFLGIKFLVYTTLMTLFLQLGFYLLKNYNSKADTETEEKLQVENKDSAAEEEDDLESADFENQEFEESEVENEFDNEGFSALNTEEFDYQQNIN
jgi:predicted membrane protein